MFCSKSRNLRAAGIGEIKQARKAATLDVKWLEKSIAVTDMNAALFDSANGYRGCIPGILEVLRRGGLVASGLP